MIDATKILQQFWGFSSFKSPQEEIINAVIKGNDTIALLPTGGGKSICFQVPTLAKEGICIVISPLIALMQDQVNNLKERGIKATSIISGSTQDEIITLFDNIRFGNYKFLYLSPERLQSSFIQEKIKQLNVNLIAIDEAHCISEWGHDFRPSYRNIAILRALKPTVNCIALTASATQKVVDDIAESLKMKNPTVVKKSFFRKNLAYQIFEIEDKLYKLNQIFTKTKSPAIIYVNSRNKTKDIATYLNANQFKSSYYHGGLTFTEKQVAFNNWMTEKTPIMVATNAFGMGIDKPNVGVIIHLDIPNSIENYLQEAGRAGRNNTKAFSVVLQNKSDILYAEELVLNSYPTIQEVKLIHKKLYQYFQIALGEQIETVFDFNLLEFCNQYSFIPNKTFNTLQILHNNGIIELNTQSQQKSTVFFLVKSAQVLAYTAKDNGLKKFVNILLRTYGGVFEKPTKIDEFFLGKKAGITSWKTISYLEKLATDTIIEYQKSTNDAALFFLVPREDDKTIHRISKNISAYINQKRKKTKDIIQFIENNTNCRSMQLLAYFDEENLEACGTCDVCIQNKKIKTPNLSKKLLLLIKEHKELSSKEICEILSEKEQDILINLQHLIAEGKIAINSHNKYYI